MPKPSTIITLRRLRYDLIDLIMRTEDAEKLGGVYRALADRSDDVGDEGGETGAVEVPRMEIPTTELKHGVTLDMIKPEKIIPPLTFQEILDMNAEEEWEQSLEELLDSID